MDSYQVTRDDLITARQQTSTVQLIGRWGGGFSKEIKYDFEDQTYMVIDHGELIRVTVFSDIAANMYNSIKPREV